MRTFVCSQSVCGIGLLLLLVSSALGENGRAGATGVTAIAPQATAASALSIVVGHSVLLDCSRQVERVSVGVGTIADTTVISPTEVLVDAKAEGETTLILWEQGGVREFFNIEVHANQTAKEGLLTAVRAELAQQIAGDHLQLSEEHGTVFLSGSVKDLTNSERAAQIASVAGKVVNLLKVEVPPAQPQILLKVVFASVDRTKSTQLGMNLFSTGLGNVIGGISTGQFSPPTISPSGTASLSSDLNIFAFFPGLHLGATIQAMESKGLVEVLAEPNVLTENGKQGSFLAGGEYPYPVVQGASGTSGPSITIMFKEYGVRLNFIPTVTPRGTIHLQVAPEVSSLDFANAIELNGFQVPAIDVRKVKTEIELNQGQSFAIGGLLDNRENETFQKIPFLGSIPILGRFFQSVSKSRTNTELIVIVTPEIVQPMPAGAPVPSLNYPSTFLPPNSTLPAPVPAQATGPQGSAPSEIPVEELIQSMKPLKPLVIDNSMAPASSGGGSGNSSASSGPQ
jgi:pilus assembly protein CpaC